MKIVEQGYRVIFERLAKAYDHFSSSSHQEYGRKARTLAGNFQVLFNLRRIYHLNFGNWGVFFEYVSHKVTRMLLPIFFVLCLAANFFIPGWFFRSLFWMQAVFYILALVGWYLEKIQAKNIFIFHLPCVFCTIHFAIVVGFWRYVSKYQKNTWERSANLDQT